MAEPHCWVVPLAAPLTYSAHVPLPVDRTRVSARTQRDADPQIQFRRVFDQTFGGYGVLKVWRRVRIRWDPGTYGWPVSRTAHSGLVLDALEQALLW